MATNYTTPVGRLVQGDCYVAQPRRDATGKPKIHPVGHPNAGQPETQYFCAVAIPKNHPEWPAFRELLAAEARLAWPQFHGADGVCTNPSFASKITDGDGVDTKGQPHSAKEGHAGHWIVKCASTFPPKVYEWDAQLGGWKETEAGKIKLGDYVRVSGTTTSNNSAQSPGMYVNLNMVAFDHEGERIVLGPTAEQAFGAPGQPAPAPTPTPAPAAAASPPAPAAPAAPPAPPYDGFMHPPVMLPAAGATTYEQYRNAGWTDEQLVAHGFMQART